MQELLHERRLKLLKQFDMSEAFSKIPARRHSEIQNHKLLHRLCSKEKKVMNRKRYPC
ncbi:hypothetical protein BDF21DRAFT_433817, partial [Thamnidium elegans]